MAETIFLKALVGLAGCIVGAMIGATSIGGVLLVPTLDVIGHISVHEAVPVCMFTFACSGLVATRIYSLRKVIHWSSLAPLSLGACPCALVGAAVSGFVPATALKLAIGIFLIFAGMQALIWNPATVVDDKPIRPIVLIILGAIAGLGSSLTGTGGALILLPTLMMIRSNLMQSIGLAQAIHVPIGIFATTTNAISGNINLSLAFWVTVTVVFGVVVGTRLVRNRSVKILKMCLGLALTAIGVFYVVRALV
jgi:uncharacterized membrane protein YfcA